MFGTCHGFAVVVVDVDTVVEAVASGVHSCVPAVSMLPVIVAPGPPPAPPLSVPVVSVEAVSVAVEAAAPPPPPKTRPPDDGWPRGFEQATRTSVIAKIG